MFLSIVYLGFLWKPLGKVVSHTNAHIAVSPSPPHKPSTGVGLSSCVPLPASLHPVCRLEILREGLAQELHSNSDGPRFNLPQISRNSE